MSLEREIEQLARDTREASRVIASAGTAQKNAWLVRAGERLEVAKDAILDANQRDISAAKEKGVAAPLVRRLELGGGKWESMLDGLRQVAALPDPVGEVTDMRVRPNGLRVGASASRWASSPWSTRAGRTSRSTRPRCV